MYMSGSKKNLALEGVWSLRTLRGAKIEKSSKTDHFNRYFDSMTNIVMNQDSNR